jgi:hypothetical protein
MVFCQQRLPLAKFTSVTIIIWGVIVIVTGLCHNWSQLMAVRL